MISFAIVSSKRSGSTLLRTLLNSTSRVYIPTESHIFTVDRMFDIDYSTYIEKIKSRGRFDTTNYQGIESLQQFLNSYENSLKTNKNSKHLLFGEKTPENIDFIENLLTYNNQIKFILLQRNHFDTILSLENRGWEGPFFLNRINYLRRCREIQKEITKNHESVSITINYEDLVSNPIVTINKILNFLGAEELKENEIDSVINFQSSILIEKSEVSIHSSLLEGKIQNRKRRHEPSIKEKELIHSLLNGNRELTMVEKYWIKIGELLQSIFQSSLFLNLKRFRRYLIRRKIIR